MYKNGNLHDCRTLSCTLKYVIIIELGGLAKLNMSKASLTEKRCLVIVFDLCNHYKSRSVSYLNFRIITNPIINILSLYQLNLLIRNLKILI